MRDENDRRVDRLELALEPLEVLHVEVVRRLVEEEEIRASRKSARERRARQLSAGERAERPVELVVGEAEAAHRRCGAIAPGPSARVLEPGLRLRVAPQRRIAVVSVGHRLLEPAQLFLDLEQVTSARERVLAQADVELERRSLVVERDSRSLLERELAALDRRLACDRTQERRLAGAVGPGEREAVLAPDREGHVLEQRIARELLAQLRCDEDGHGR